MNEDLRRFTRKFLASLRKDLVLDPGGKKGYFRDVILDNHKAWKAERLPDSDPQAKSRHAVSRFKYPRLDIEADPDKVLDLLRPALRAYCAGIEYLRSGDDDLFDVCQGCWLEWTGRKRAIQLSNSANGSVRGNKRHRILDPVKAKQLLAQGHSKTQVAETFGVTRQAVQKLFGPTRKNKKAT